MASRQTIGRTFDFAKMVSQSPADCQPIIAGLRATHAGALEK